MHQSRRNASLFSNEERKERESTRGSISRSPLSLSLNAKTNRKVKLDGDDVDDDRPVGPGSVARSDGLTP